ncbi:hypothetical protein [Granulibacter bethesdensis]|uniref:hypothetical protein n=1 Tax=Granulibacter bethesdensis TaxID=364410 RepID=UPI0003F20624|nr:hypothetical protein [Granulibacter bethesdensis]APG31164.1 Hypothetical protein GbCGDNIH4_1852 [Granulibacter bethesdensis CGDNIH4]
MFFSGFFGIWKNYTPMSENALQESGIVICKPSPLVDRLKEFSANDPFSHQAGNKGCHYLHAFALGVELCLQLVAGIVDINQAMYRFYASGAAYEREWQSCQKIAMALQGLKITSAALFSEV